MQTNSPIPQEITSQGDSSAEATKVSLLPFSPTYDADGNAVLIWTETGVWVVSYNAQNRPVSFRNDATDTLVECAYDYRGRRCTKKVTVAGTVTPAGTLFLGRRKNRSLFRHFIASAILLAVMTP